MNTEDITALTKIAYQFGPFFFALLFTLVISRWTYKIYHKQQKSTTKEKNTYRWVFISTTFFGMLLVIVSVIWWWNYRPTTYVFRGEVKKLKDYERVVSGNLYFRSRWTGKLGENIPQFHDEEFAVIQETPFSQNQPFDMLFSKEPDDPNPKSFTIKYLPGDKLPRYEIVWNDSTHENQLKRLSDSTTSSNNGFRFLFFDRAFAQGIKSQHLNEGKEPAIIQMPEQAANKHEDIISILQDERTDVGSKIAALDKLRTFDKKSLFNVITTQTEKENMILTISDLARHTDRELAFKAQQLSNLVNLNKIISDRLNSKNGVIVNDAQQIVRRLDKAQATTILKSVNTKQSDEMKRFAKDISSGRALTPLKPTGSSKGDRYYVRAQWNPNDKKTVDCLTQLFNQELFDRPSLQKEADFMRGRSERWVYWYSKEWALEIAAKINRCGGKASFGSP
ncbi:MAG: hypothetical protein ABSB78_14345 [Bacteroidota bacterium]